MLMDFSPKAEAASGDPGLEAAEQNGVSEEGHGPAGRRDAGGRTSMAEAETVEAEPAEEVEAASKAPEFITLFGRVLDPEGEPVEGALVFSSMDAKTTRTDEEGSFRLPVAPRRPGWQGEYSRRLDFWAEGHPVMNETAYAGRELLVRLEKDPGLNLTVVQDGDKTPLAGVEVEMGFQSEAQGENRFQRTREWVPIPRPAERTDSAGKLSLPASGNYYLRFRLQGFADRTMRMRRPRGTRDNPVEKTVSLKPERDLRVRFLDRQGNPLAGAEIVFGRLRPAQKTDEQGWALVTPAAIYGGSEILVIRQNRYWLHYQSLRRLKGGEEIVVGHFPRPGRLLLQEPDQDLEFEVATIRVQSGFGVSYYPHPLNDADLLQWVAADAEGRFEVEPGWQAEKTGILVREKESRRLRADQTLEGDGPYEIALKPKQQLTATVLVEPKELLDGAHFVLRTDHWGERGIRETAKVELIGGQAELEVTPGRYNARLQLAGRDRWRVLGDVDMPEGPHEVRFDLGRLRTLSGRLTAVGEPVYPANIQLTDEHEHGDDNFHEWLSTDPDGRWQVEAVPERSLRFAAHPENRWLGPVADVDRIVPAQSSRHDVALPVAKITLTTSRPDLIRPGKVTLERKAPPGVERDVWDRRWGPPLKFPDLKDGPVTLTMSPCLLTFQHRDSFWQVKPREVVVQADSILTLDLVPVAQGLVQVEMEDKPAIRAQEIKIAPEGQSSWSEQEQRSYRFYGRDGWSKLASFRLDPGRYQMEIRGPLRQRWRRDEPLAGEDAYWKGDFVIEDGRLTKIVLAVDEQGALVLKSQTTGDQESR
ncbi:MAG: carboxypeptidase regulatory-like domain-containing protein [Planctomycetota bacterium]|nr:MAG: carboxypeptidase regulatory-like domain-containing protein [Planctomycetota bacterium]